MPQSADLYDILYSYAKKNNSPYINIGDFVQTLENHARRCAEKEPGWNFWINDTGAKVWSELSRLADEKRCALISNDSGTRVFMYQFYVELIEKAYLTIEDTSEMPFPSEESLNIIIPPAQIRPFNLETDFFECLENSQETLLPVIKIIFPEDAGAALALPNMIPRRLLEAAMLKIRTYLRGHGNKEYIQQEIGYQFGGKEGQLKDQFNQILIRPFECINGMASAGEFSFYFWMFFCNSVKKDIKKKAELLFGDLAALQSVYLIEAANSFFKTRADREKAKAQAFKELERRFDSPPLLYSLEEIVKFSDHKGIPLLGQYSQGDLESYLVDCTTRHGDKELPPMLIIHGLHDEQWFVKKNKLISLCMRLLAEARSKVKKAVSNRWVRLLKSYSREPAMERDDEFEKLLAQYAAKLVPALAAILRDTKLYLVYEEFERTQGMKETAAIFNRGKLIPMDALLLVKRKDLLADARIVLPFWYTLPLFSAVIVFIKGLGRKKRAGKSAEEDDELGEDAAGTEPDGSGVKEAAAAAKKLMKTYVPEGYTLGSYLAELETRWGRLIDKKARRNLVEDVNSLIRDRLRYILRRQHHHRITVNGIKNLSAKIIQDSPVLRQLPEKESLRIYIQLYIVKALAATRI
jgi:hypothetical protein